MLVVDHDGAHDNSNLECQLPIPPRLAGEKIYFGFAVKILREDTAITTDKYDLGPEVYVAREEEPA